MLRKPLSKPIPSSGRKCLVSKLFGNRIVGKVVGLLTYMLFSEEIVD
jgi:hypothetical protein